MGNHTIQTIFLTAVCLLLAALPSRGQEEEESRLELGVQLLGHGEVRNGGFNESMAEEEADDNSHAGFMMSRTRVTADFLQKGLSARVTAQHAGVWGQKGQGSLNLNEAWARLSLKNGLFAQLGRQALSYDDERIIGPNDWAMAYMTHDVLKLGYEGNCHRLHAILAYNQNAENTYGGTYYADGAQPYKTMHTVWYHYDWKAARLGASLLLMNIGMQAGEKNDTYNRAHTEYQQLIGTYMKYEPKRLKAEASYYRQLGKNELGQKMGAWMTSVSAQWQAAPAMALTGGFDYLSGDKYFAVPGQGQIGMVRHDKIRGFNPIYGSHHKFYGMMDFFYVSTYVNGFSPGLQNLYAGGSWKPTSKLDLKVTYHYMAMATKLAGMDMTLGHDIDIEGSYELMKEAKLMAGFSLMWGTDTMERLKRASSGNNLSWGWVSLVVTPKKAKIKIGDK